MSFGNFGELSIAINLIFIMLVSAMVLAFIRLLRGPSLPDRVVSLDLNTSLVVGFISAYAIGTNQPVFLDIAIVLVLISFLSTVAFGLYIERRARDE